jgi:ParB family transcriptional regulator, chromosome partitioning protein
MPKSEAGTLRQIPPDSIDRNPDNPRLVFRPEELSTLMASIRRHGIQVPLTVFQEGRRFVLIDGERRWRCARKLNLSTVPALVREPPSPLDNLLLMFNIHALREQWDYFTIANKLPRIVDLFKTERHREPTEAELSEETGLSRGQIRRCRLLLQLPAEYRNLLVSELELPKAKQQLSEDFFIEMERALKTIRNRLPDAVHDLDEARRTLITKYRAGMISNVVEFRQLRKMATSVDRLGVKRNTAQAAIRTVLEPASQKGISAVYHTQFEAKFDAERAAREAAHLVAFLDACAPERLTGELKTALIELRDALNIVLQGPENV